MKLQTKKIIAREGLVIIACLICSAISFFIGSAIPYQSPTYRYSVLLGGHKHILTFLDDNPSGFSDEDKKDIIKSLKEKFPTKFSNESNFNPDDLTIKYLGTKYSLKQHIKNAGFNFGIIFLIVAYPIYLFIRFILWAIRTLKQKER